jgi:hypothetical protein
MAFFPCILELTQQSLEANNFYPDTATIFEEPAATIADKGEAANAVYPTDWTPLVTNEPCRFYPSQASFREGQNGSQVQEQGEFRALLKADLLRPSTRARVRIVSNGTTLDFEIVGIRDSSDKVMTILELNRANPPVAA